MCFLFFYYFPHLEFHRTDEFNTHGRDVIKPGHGGKKKRAGYTCPGRCTHIHTRARTRTHTPEGATNGVSCVPPRKPAENRSRRRISTRLKSAVVRSARKVYYTHGRKWTRRNSHRSLVLSPIRPRDDGASRLVTGSNTCPTRSAVRRRGQSERITIAVAAAAYCCISILSLSLLLSMLRELERWKSFTPGFTVIDEYLVT